METTTEKPVLDVEAPGVRVAVYAPTTAETYARIWNGGPDGWRKPTTAAYWRKVRVKLETKHKETK